MNVKSIFKDTRLDINGIYFKERKTNFYLSLERH